VEFDEELVRKLMRAMPVGDLLADGDAEAVATEHQGLEKLIDRAVARGALHRNAGARKKAQAARVAAGSDA